MDYIQKTQRKYQALLPESKYVLQDIQGEKSKDNAIK